jgi:hypothetical protein
MALNMKDLDLSTIIDGMENIVHETKMNQAGTHGFNESDGTRVTASGFTETDIGNYRPYTNTEMANRRKIARDVSGMLRLVKFPQIDVEYYNDLIVRYSSSDRDREAASTELQDLRMLRKMSGATKKEMDDVANEMKSDLNGMRGASRSAFENPFNTQVNGSDSDDLSTVTKPLNIQKRPSRRDSVVESTIYAHESVSQVGNNRLNSKGLTRTTSSRVDSTVIGGYRPTLSVLDEDDNVEIAPIHGLPKVFVNDRLNFLCHLHKPLYELLSDGQTYPATDIFPRLERFMKKHRGREREPEANLLYMVIKNTFSLSKMQVRENPFSMPLLEPGMFLDEEIIYMCIEQLHSEYSLQWFTSMKSVAVPAFHDKYKIALKGTRTRQPTTQRENESKRRQSRSFVNF